MLLDKFEFDQAQNRLMADLAKKMRLVGVGFAAVAILIAAAELVKLLHELVLNVEEFVGFAFAALLALIGVWTVKAGRRFGEIVLTSGHDIQNLMDALANLLKLYTMLYWLLMSAVFFLALLLASLVMTGLDTQRAL